LINLFPTTLSHAYLIASLLFCAALIPMALIKIKAPQISLDNISIKELSRISPVGVIGSITAGSALGSVYNMAPVFAKGLGISTVDISIFMISIVLSGVLLQHSIDRLSRIVRRHIVLLFVLLALCCNALLVVKLKESLPLPILGIMIGSLIACIYPISLNITSDNYQGNNGVSVSSTMLLFYGIGGVVGPILSGKAMAVFGNEALFYYLVISILCAIGLIVFFHGIGARRQPI
jgi:MFS family permease